MTSRLKSDVLMDEIGALVHAGLVLGHALGLYYNWRRGNRRDVALHLAFMVYDGVSTIKHLRGARWQDDGSPS